VASPSVTELAARGLRLDIDDAVATVTLSRPERRNAMTPGMWHGLAMLGASLPARVRVVVVRGAGPSFSAGIDLRMFSGEPIPGEEPAPSAAEPGFEDWIASVQAGYTWLRDPAIVSVAAVQGHAIGAGCQLALACDLRVLADDAKLCIKEPALGLVPDLTGTKPLVEIVGLSRAIELCLTGRTVGAAEAGALRLAELVVPAAELDEAVADLVAALLATDAAAARATKALLVQAANNTFEEQAAAERGAQAALLRSRPS
jgi:enoyl-CoA hydratase/carnithine racemase